MDSNGESNVITTSEVDQHPNDEQRTMNTASNLPPVVDLNVASTSKAGTKISKVTKKAKNTPLQNSCKACKDPDNDKMVQCDKCDRWYHFSCVGVDKNISKIPWQCILCKNTVNRPQSGIISRSGTTLHRSARSMTSQLSDNEDLDVLQLEIDERRIQLNQKKLELEKERLVIEERRLALRKNKTKSSGASFASFWSANERTSSWVDSQSEVVKNEDISRKPNHHNSATWQMNRINAVIPPSSTPNKATLNTIPPIYENQVQMPFRGEPGRTFVQQSHRPTPVTTTYTLELPSSPVVSSAGIYQQSTQTKFMHPGGTMPTPYALNTATSGYNPQLWNPLMGNEVNLLATRSNNIVPPTDEKPSTIPPKFSNSFPRIGHLRSLTEDQIAFRMEKEALPNFSGSPGEWPIFITTYNRTTANCNYTNDENLSRLIKALTGNARNLVKGRLRSSNAVPSIIDTLFRNYGRPDIIMDEIVADIKKHPTVTEQRMDLLLSYSAMVEDLCASIQETCTTSYLNDGALLKLLVSKLPVNLQLDWSKSRAMRVDSKNDVNLETFNAWLIEISRAVCYMPKPTIDQKKSENRVIRRNSRNVHTIAVHSTNQPSDSKQQQQGSTNCVVCNKGVHKPDKCQLFLDMSRKERWDCLKKNRMCFVCLAKHNVRCPESKKCGVDGCGRYHHALLHNSGTTNVGSDVKATVIDNEKASVNYHQTKSSTIYRITPIELHGPEKSLTTFAFVDEGSSTTLIEEHIANQLQLTGPTTNLCLRWTNDVSRLEEKSKVVSMLVSGVNDCDKKYRISGNTVKQLSLPIQTLDDEMISKFDHLKQLPISCFKNQKPTMIIGLDNYRLVVPMETISGKWEDPIAVNTRLGWMVYGTLRGRIQDAQLNCHLCECNENIDNIQPLVEAFWSLDSFGVGSGKILESQDDICAKTIMERTTHLVNGRYETGLLWRRDDIKFPNSRHMAMKRLFCFENKLSRDPELMAIVNDKIEDYIKKGYVQKLRDDELKIGPKTWYLPIFTVRNPNKPAKVRVVWDAAAKAYGVSLNDFLLKGPDNLTPLVEVLSKFRENKYAITGDICEMYHRVLVNKEDSDSQRFLWRNCDRSREPEEYVMRVMTFGASCSPSLAQNVKNVNAERFIDDYPRAVDAIKNRHYVDDWLDSFETSQEAIDVIQQVIRIHEAAGFHIRGWCSNDPEVLRSIGQTVSSDPKSMVGSDVVTEKVLGMWWQTDVDSFVFRMNQSRIDVELLNGAKTPTKRQVLSIVMSTFDPLGLISPIVAHGKVIVQEVWKSGVDWDDEIGQNQLSKWVDWAQHLESIEKIEIPRRYFMTTSNDKDSKFDLHVFCDAGGDAYSACAYVLNTYHGRVEVSLVASKTRVNPKKVLSVPRLELLAAVLAVRLMNSVKSSHAIVFNSQTVWSDSTTVLSWIKSDARRYKQFVALRISECLESTEIHQWRYVPTKQNIADMGTKWPINLQRLSTEWIFGPKFLYEDPSMWPKHPNLKNIEPEDELLHRVMFVSSTTMNIITPNLESFSTWFKMVRAQAYFNRAVQNFRCKRQLYQRGPLTVKEIREAEIILFKKAQCDAYKKEVAMLSSKSQTYVEKTSDLYSYSPYVDEKGLLRVKGRIEKAQNIPFSAKRPVILPKNHIVTRRLLEWYHKAFLHQNHSSVINEVRQKFMIPKLRILYAQIRTKCQYCKVKSATPRPPEMAVIPKARLQTFVRPFYHTGIDLFGPLEVTIGRRNEKRWCCLFTCMTTRGIHLELVNSLTADSCVRSLSMFVARRGLPHKIFTDNGTNFHGANNALITEFARSSSTCPQLAKIEWEFIPPGSPHFGGAWERLIGIVKSNLMSMFKTRKPSEEVLRSCLCEVENIVNTRPLTHISLDIEDAESLTPNHFIHGTSDGYKPLCEIKDIREPTYKDWRFIQWVAEHFWKRFVKEYLPELTRRTKWFGPVPSLEIGDLVLIVDERNSRGSWPRGKIIDVTKGDDGVVRSATIKTSSGLYTRPSVKLAKLDVEGCDQGTVQSIDKGDNVEFAASR